MPRKPLSKKAIGTIQRIRQKHDKARGADDTDIVRKALALYERLLREEASIKRRRKKSHGQRKKTK